MGPPPRLGEFADRWVRNYVLPTNRLSSQRAKLNVLRIHLLPQLGSLRLGDITTARVDAFRASLHARRLAPKSINNILSVLRCCLTTAKEWSLIRTVPTFHWLRVPTQGYKYLTPEQAAKLLAATHPGLWRVLILFMLHTGVRFGEAAGITWDDLELDTEQPLVHIRRSVVLRHVGPTKTGRPRDIPLTPSVVEALRGFERHHPYVFSLRDGDFIVPTTTLSYLHRICHRAAIPPISWHGLRHTFATELTSRGVPLRAVQELLGHTTIQMTSRYAHVAPSTLHAAVAVLERPNSTFGHQVDTNAQNSPDQPEMVA